jgi:hypothetical protein
VKRSDLHPAEIGRGIKTESGSGSTNQPPREASTTQQRSGKAAQGLRAGSGNRPTSHRRARGGSWSLSLGKKTLVTTDLSYLVKGRADQTELQLKGNTTATW